MFAFSRPVQYTIRALGHLSRAGQGAICRVEEIAKAERIPKAYLAKLLQQLARQGLLDSHKGPSGGFSLRMQPTEISLSRIYEAFPDFRHPFETCLLGYRACDCENPCGLHAHFSQMKDSLKQALGNLRLADV